MAAPAAPAQVDVDDPALAVGEPDDAAESIATEVYAAVRDRRVAALAGGPLEVVSIAIEVVRDDLELSTSQGLHAAWTATEARVTALLAAGGRTTVAEARARRRSGLELVAAITAAAERLGGLPAAASPPPGSYAVVLRLAALAPLAGRGLFEVFAAQADAALVRRGLSRWRPGQAVVEDAAADPEPLTIVSDGTLPYGLRSAPVGEQGEPVRRFTLVERGIARDLAFDQREAALAGARPNGGVRTLAVAPGATPAAELVGRRAAARRRRAGLDRPRPADRRLHRRRRLRVAARRRRRDPGPRRDPARRRGRAPRPRPAQPRGRQPRLVPRPGRGPAAAARGVVGAGPAKQ